MCLQHYLHPWYLSHGPALRVPLFTGLNNFPKIKDMMIKERASESYSMTHPPLLLPPTGARLRELLHDRLLHLQG